MTQQTTIVPSLGTLRVAINWLHDFMLEVPLLMHLKSHYHVFLKIEKHFNSQHTVATTTVFCPKPYHSPALQDVTSDQQWSGVSVVLATLESIYG